MGVPGLATLFKRNHRWRTDLLLKECKLVVDATDELYWFVQKSLLGGHDKMDKFAFNMVAYGQLIRMLFLRLRLAKVTPIVVYNGARLSEQLHGPLVSKRKFLEKSAQVRLYLMNKNGAAGLNHTIVPPLACNVLKQVINELQIEAHQSTYEVYPLLIKLANDNDCPVLTSHRDLIFANVKRGFLLFEELNLLDKQYQPVWEIATTNLYQHHLLLSSYNISPHCSQALATLFVLLRPDFCGKYYDVVNRMFSMPSHLRIKQDETEFVRNHRPERIPWNKLVEHILQNWPRQFVDVEDVRKAFERSLNSIDRRISSNEAMKEFDALWLSFSDISCNIAALLPEAGLDQIVRLNDALIKRESTAPFLTDVLMRQTNVDRLRIEDLQTFRSTYSLADPVKMLLLSGGQSSPWQPQALTIFDRQRSELLQRTLQVNPALRAVGNIEAPDQMLYRLFLFPSQVASNANLRAFIRDSRQSASGLMKISLAFKDELQVNMSEQIIVLLRLAVFSFILGLRDNYDLPRLDRSKGTGSQAAAKSLSSPHMSGGKSVSDSLSAGLGPNKVYANVFPLYLDAIYNSVLYYCFKENLLKGRLEENELLRDDVEGGFYSKVNLAAKEIESDRIRSQITVYHEHYLVIKHLGEMLNSSLHAYMELNSFYNHPGVQLKLAGYYDCHLIHRICYYMLRVNKPHKNLLKIESTDRLFSLISDYPLD